MTTTTFVTGVTVIEADWLNDVDAAAGGDTCTDAVFAHTADVHYQSTNMTTKSRNYPFYT